MAKSKLNPEGVATPLGAQDINSALAEGRSIIAGEDSRDNKPAVAAIKAIRRGPGGKAEWYVSIEGICTDAPMRDRRLRHYKRFRNVVNFRFGISLDPTLSQANWAAIVEAAIEKGGVA